MQLSTILAVLSAASAASAVPTFRPRSDIVQRAEELNLVGRQVCIISLAYGYGCGKISKVVPPTDGDESTAIDETSGETGLVQRSEAGLDLVGRQVCIISLAYGYGCGKISKVVPPADAIESEGEVSSDEEA